jgi:hypothetical protein
VQGAMGETHCGWGLKYNESGVRNIVAGWAGLIRPDCGHDGVASQFGIGGV